MVANDEDGLFGLIAIETRQGGCHQFVTMAYLKLVESEQVVIVVGLLRLEFVEDAIGYEHCLGVVDIQCGREGACS